LTTGFLRWLSAFAAVMAAYFGFEGARINLYFGAGCFVSVALISLWVLFLAAKVNQQIVNKISEVRS
jgi:hypothetical protein